MQKKIRIAALLILVFGVICATACGRGGNEATEKGTEGKITEHGTEINDIEVNSTESPEKDTQAEEPNEIELLLKKEWKDKYVPELAPKFAKYIEGYDGYLALISVDGDTMRISSSNYDGDARDSFIVREVKIAKNVEYYDLSINTVINDKGEKSTDTYMELTEEDMETILDSTLGIGFVWFNEDMEIEKIMFYGELINWE